MIALSSGLRPLLLALASEEQLHIMKVNDRSVTRAEIFDITCTFTFFISRRIAGFLILEDDHATNFYVN